MSLSKVKVGVWIGFTITSKVVFNAHWPFEGVKV